MASTIAPPLSWVKPEVDHALKAVRDSIAQFMAAPEEPAVLKKCPEQLHQVTGALHILGLSGAMGFCESMEHAFAGVNSGPLAKKSTISVLDRAVLALKEFIDGLSKGEANAPIKLFPVYREISTLQGKTEVTEKDLFFPDLTLDAPLHPAAQVVTKDKLPNLLQTQRSRYQRGLLAWLRNPAEPQGLQEMRQALETLDIIANQLPHPRALWWVAIGLIDGLLHAGKDEWSAGAKALCSKLDLRMRDLATGKTARDDHMLRDTLFAIAKCKPATPRIREIKQQYQLDSLFPEPDLPGFMEYDMDWLEPALNEARSRIEAIKSVWVQYISGESGALQRFRESVTELKAKINDLGNMQLIRMLEVIVMVSTRLPDPYPRQSQMMITEMASAFLLTENIVDHFTETPADLDQQVAIMGGWLLDAASGKSAGEPPQGLRADLSQQASKIQLQAQVAREIVSNLQHVEQVLDAFARDRSKYGTLPALQPYLKQIQGALTILGFRRAAELQALCTELVAHCAKPDFPETDRDLEIVVEGLSSLGFFLDPCLRGLSPSEAALEAFFTRQEQQKSAQPPAADAVAAEAAAPEAQPAADIAASIQQPATAAATDAASTATVPAVSEDLLDVYLEEAQEVLASINAALPVCRNEPQNLESLTTIRRGFHTLKGSGRMVGLTDLGEIAWEMEQVMNRWLKQQWPAAPALLELIAVASASFSTWVSQLSAKQPLQLDAQPLLALALQLRNAQSPDAVSATGAASPPAKAAEPAPEPDEILIGDLRISRSFYEIYLKEAQQHLVTLQAECAAWEENPGIEATNNLLRAAHTLASISRTAGLLPPADLAMRLEQCLPYARYVTTEDDFGLIRAAVARLREMITAISRQEVPVAADAEATALENMIVRMQDYTLPKLQIDLVDDGASETALSAAAETLSLADLIMPEDESPLPAIAETMPTASPTPEAAASLDFVSLPEIVTPVAFPESVTPVDAVAPPELIAAPELVPSMAVPEPAAAVTPPTAPAPVAPVAPTPEFEQTVVRASALRNIREQRAIRDDIDLQLLPIFLEEALELLPQIGRDLRDWKAAPADRQILQSLQRALHTFKGSARMAGAMRLGELAHLMESKVDTALEFSGAHSNHSIAIAQIEELESHMDRLSEGMERLQSEDHSAPPASAAATPAASETPEVATIAAQAVPAAKAEVPLQAAAMLRINADALDRLINEAGEVGIARSRIEGELRNVKQSLLELSDSVLRLRGQLREMEIQADSQMQSRMSIIESDKHGFDPLEFDRYTRLQELTRLMTEGLHDVTTVQQTLLRNLGEVDAAVLQQARINRELQQELMRTRTVPFANLEERLYRIARQTSRDLDKKINLEISGSHIELDRSVLERISAPLEHLLRNAIGHGIESQQDRHAAGKTDAGEITIALRQESNEIVITIGDDGAGLNLPRLRAKGLEKGLLAPGQDISDADLMELIFTPGFSTAETVTELSGRGVGMDVVRNEITAIRGRIETASTPGKGTMFSIYLPLTLAVAQAVLVRAGSQIFAISSPMVELVMRLKPDELSAYYRVNSVDYRGNSFPLHYLQHLIGKKTGATEPQNYSSVLLLRSGTQRIALHVDELIGNQEVVVKHINPQLASVPGVTGATVLGDGRVVLIMNPVLLAHRPQPDATATILPPQSTISKPAAPMVMVVDDSLTVRKITGRLLEREGYRVCTAKDGVDALEQLKDTLPDIMLVDIEMPRMDGFDLSSNVRQDPRTTGIPIIIISSRTAEKHRSRAQQIGVNAFLGKPYEESDLLRHIAQFLNQPQLH